MELSSLSQAIINVAFNNESNKVEDFNIIKINHPGDPDYIQTYNLFARKIIKKSRLDENDIPDIDILCYYLTDLNKFSFWPDKPEVRFIENVILPYIHNNGYTPICKKNTLDIEFKRLAVIGKDIKQTLNLEKTPQLLAKYKNEVNVTKKQINKLLDYFETKNISPNKLPYQVVDKIIDALFQTQYYQQVHLNVSSSLVKADYIHPLSLFLSYFIYSHQDSMLMNDLYRLQNTTSPDECIQLIRKYNNLPHITGKQAEILVLKLNPENLFSLKQFQPLDPAIIFKELSATQYYQMDSDKNYLFSTSHAIQIIELQTKIEDIRNKIAEITDPDESELLKGILKRYIIEKINTELNDIYNLPDEHISQITLNRLKSILSFINNNLSYEIPETVKTKAIKLLSWKEHILQNCPVKTEYIIGLSPVSDLGNNIAYLIDSVAEGNSRLIIPDQASNYVSVAELKSTLLSFLNVTALPDTQLLHTRFIFPNIAPDKEDFIVEKIINNYLANIHNLNFPSIAFTTQTPNNRIDLNILNNASKSIEQTNLILPQWIEKLAKKYHLFPCSESSKNIHDKLEKETVLFGKNIPKTSFHVGPHL